MKALTLRHDPATFWSEYWKDAAVDPHHDRLLARDARHGALLAHLSARGAVHLVCPNWYAALELNQAS